MPIVIVPTPAPGSGSGMTKKELRAYTRYLIDTYGDDWVQDSSTTRFSIDDALNMALTKWYVQTKCSRGTYTVSTAIGTDTYNLTSFDAGATRLFDVYLATYDSVRLMPINPDRLDSLNRKWRLEGDSTPIYWLMWNENEVRLYPSPDAVKTLSIEGYQGPDFTAFDADGDYPPGMNVADHEALCYMAAFICIIGVPNESNIARMPNMLNMWNSKVAGAKSRVIGANSTPVIMGSGIDMGRSRMTATDTVTML